jgi:hypothetical protein
LWSSIPGYNLPRTRDINNQPNGKRRSLPGKESAMKTSEDKSAELLDAIVDLQAIETENITSARKEIAKTKNSLTRAMMKVLEVEAEKRCLLHGMLSDSLQKEAFNLSPEELNVLSSHLNRTMEAEDNALLLAKEAYKKSELPIHRFLTSYLINDLKKENDLLRQFEADLKGASISTSITSKTFGKSMVA